MISCDEARIICHKTQYKDATLWEVIKLNFHLFICKACSAFSRKNKKLTTLCEEATMSNLSEEEKLDMKRRIQEKL